MRFGKINCLLFDLDGVLFDGQPLQVESTLEILRNYIKCTKDVKSLVNETITTKEKLKILNLQGLIKKKEINEIYLKKKMLFEKRALRKIRFSERLNNTFKEIKKRKLKVGVVTNSNYKSAKKILKKLKILKYIDILVTNGNRVKPKPNPDPYNYAMSKIKVRKENTLIFEDSPVGLLSAKRTGAHYFKIYKPTQINEKFLKKILK